MRLSDDLEKKFQDQITLEFAASITYRQLAIEADEQDLPGIAAWLRHQADEEIVHADKFIQHVSDRGNHAAIGAIPAPRSEERRVGKECRSRWWSWHERTKKQKQTHREERVR